MALTPKLEIRQSQSLLMTPQLRQAINLLQLNNLELNELLDQELQNNPLLEREDDRLKEAPDDFGPTIDDLDEGSNTQVEHDTEYDSQFDDFGSDCEGYEDSGADWEDKLAAKTKSEDDYDYFQKKLSTEPSLYTKLNEQITATFPDRKDRLIAGILSEGLDESGYFRGSSKAIAARLNTSPEQIQAILDQMKSFEPSGLFAENLKECLTIQLKDLNRFDPLIAKLLDNLDLLAARNYKELKRILDVSDEDLLDMIKDIRALNPKPAADYHLDPPGSIIPDVLVKTNNHGDYRVELNSATLPRLLINRQYYAEIKALSQSNKEASRYLKDQLHNASFLTKALHQRATTILRVSEEIVRRQRDFFKNGIESLKPMLLKDVAEAIEMHESTVSRVTTNKYMHTPRGTFELKYFFSAKAGSYKPDDDTSTTAIKHKLKKMIDEESPDNILSDDKLVEEMAKSGIKIARRTVAKYRESLNLPTSADRKRSKRNNI